MIRRKHDEKHTYLVRAEDPAIKEIRGFDPRHARYFADKTNIEWNSDKIIVNTWDGIQAYEFDFR